MYYQLLQQQPASQKKQIEMEILKKVPWTYLMNLLVIFNTKKIEELKIKDQLL